MSLRIGWLMLGFGAALACATAVALGVGAFEEEALIVVRPVELVDPALEDPFDLDPLFAPGRGARSEERSVVLAGGDRVTLRIADGPILRLGDDDVDFIELADAALGEAGEPDAVAARAGARFAVYAVLTGPGREAWLPFAARHATDFLLVELAARPVDLVRPLGWSRGLRIGVFADERSRLRYVESLDLKTHSTTDRAPD